MQTKRDGNLIFIRLFPGEDIFQELGKACQEQGVETAVVLSGVGQLKEFELGYFKEKGNYVPEHFKDTYELLSISGNISRQADGYNFHLHAVLGDEKKTVVGGHLFRGMVEVTNEIVLLTADLKLIRKLDEGTGLQAMFLPDA